MEEKNKFEEVFDEKKELSILVIGDTHFKKDRIREGILYNSKIIDIATKTNPDFIVILGDILHTQNTVDINAHNIAENLIDSLSKIYEVYILIGNHDYINNQQFLTPNHIFGPFKKWNNVIIVDKPLSVRYGEFTFVMCPYTPDGRLVEALDTLIGDEEDWQMADCVFGHQKMSGCKIDKFNPTGDKWDENYPPFVGGHIHDEEIIGSNVYLPGASTQVAASESPTKKVWIMKFGEKFVNESSQFKIEKIPVGMKGRKIVHMDVDDIPSKLTPEEVDRLLEMHHLKLEIKGTNSQFTIFRRSNLFNSLKKKGVIISFDHTKNLEIKSKDDIQTSFLGALGFVVNQKSKFVQKAYTHLIPKNERPSHKKVSKDLPSEDEDLPSEGDNFDYENLSEANESSGENEIKETSEETSESEGVEEMSESEEAEEKESEEISESEDVDETIESEESEEKESEDVEETIEGEESEEMSESEAEEKESEEVEENSESEETSESYIS